MNCADRIIIGADLVPTESNKHLFVEGDKQALLGAELSNILSDATYRIFNLEVPLTDTSSPIRKCGPNLIAPIATINGYKAIDADILTLANNHILDQGEQGLNSTCEILKKNNIAYLGAGKDPAEAAEPYIFTFAQKKIGIYACVEHEFSLVTENSAGANPFDPLESPDHIARLKSMCDFVIVLYHGGKEHYRYPSPNLQKVCRKLIDKGADIVVCQHSHCVGCEEKYRDGTIVYGQGNFLFDASESEYWQTSLLIELDEAFGISYIPIMKDGCQVKLATADQASVILRDFTKRSEEILSAEFVEKKYREFADKMLNNYLVNISGMPRNLLFRAFNKLSGYRLTKQIIKKKFSCEWRLQLWNYIECEAHRELILCGMENAVLFCHDKDV